MNKQTVITQGLKFYAMRSIVAAVFWVMAVAIEQTNLSAGVATKYDALGVSGHVMRHYLSLMLIIAAPLNILFRRWYIDFFSTIPFMILFYFSVLYYQETQNLTAPVLYGSVWLLLIIALWARKWYEQDES